MKHGPFLPVSLLPWPGFLTLSHPGSESLWRVVNNIPVTRLLDRKSGANRSSKQISIFLCSFSCSFFSENIIFYPLYIFIHIIRLVIYWILIILAKKNICKVYLNKNFPGQSMHVPLFCFLPKYYYLKYDWLILLDLGLIGRYCLLVVIFIYTS